VNPKKGDRRKIGHLPRQTEGKLMNILHRKPRARGGTLMAFGSRLRWVRGKRRNAFGVKALPDAFWDALFPRS
jgi:hypothetical protein